MPSPKRKILYTCRHEISDPRFQSPKKPSILKRIKRALSFPDTIRTPSQQLCPYCQRLDDESQELKAAEQRERYAAPPRFQTSPAQGSAAVPNRCSSTLLGRTTRASDYLDDPAAPRNPYRDTKMQIIRNQYEGSCPNMSERVVEGLANEKPGDRIARLNKMREVQADWNRMEARRGKEPPKTWEDMFGPRPSRVPGSASRAQSQDLDVSPPGTSVDEDTEEEVSLAVKQEMAKQQKAEKAERARKRAAMVVER
ncbi:hypothetical protein DSL72_002247 [Monilinia vaccinii-corymbosi]|uniref:Uncharacterized protein n=1 Tax=Monilinia vaccinii-corymbosi TaxID=61207 RepID=A0A8A3PC66_9HELO|nr:hypothetical protein DSL72_002247 [Monilinia vaccinii-corymbosi]